MKKSFVSVIVLLSLLIPSLAAVPQTAFADGLPFRDVDPGDWYYGSVERAYREGILVGLTADTFGPESEVTRAQLVTVVCRLSGDEPAGFGGVITFVDTTVDAWYADYVGWAFKAGVLEGYPDGTFRPDEPVTRAELAVVLARFFDHRDDHLVDAPLVASFSDADETEEWAREAVEMMRSCGIFAGDPAGRFNPSSPASRAEIAAAVERYLDAERVRKVDWLMDHYLDYLPHSGKFVTLGFSIAKLLSPAGFSSRMFPYFGISEDEYELLADEEQLSYLRGEWVGSNYGSTFVTTLAFSLRERATGATSKSVNVMFKLTKVEENFYVDPDDFDPGVDAEIYSAMKDAALSYTGSTARLYRALDKGLSTGELTVAFIGGSITAGSTAIPGGGYADVCANWLRRHITEDLTYVNAAIGGTHSGLGNSRLERDVLSKDPDIVFIEYAVNDDPGRTWLHETFESLVRTALSAENDPAVVIVISRGGEWNIPFMSSVAERYGVPVVNVSAAIGYGTDLEAFTEEEFRPDTVHPDDWGHQVMSDMTEELFRRALGEWDSAAEAEAAIVTALPGPITPSRLEGLTLVDAEDLDIVSMGSFRFTGEDRGNGFRRGARSTASDGREPIVFTVTAKSVMLVLDSGTEVMISVDGGEPFHSGSVSVMQDCPPIVFSGAAAPHTISITPQDDSAASLLAVAYN